MPVAAFAPNRLHTDYSEWTAPGIAHSGKVWAWNNTTGKYEPTALSFDPAGTAAAAVATHVAAGDPHSQYALESALGTAAALNVGTGANNVVQLNGSGQLPAVSGALLTNLPAAAASGSTTQVQYNNAGTFAGDAGMTYDAANDRLTVAGGLVAPSMRPASNSTTALQLQNAAGTAVVTVDTTNEAITLSNSQINIGARTGGVISFWPRSQGNSLFEIFPYTGNATEYVEFSVYGHGIVSNISAYHRLQFGFRPTPSQYAIWVQGQGVTLPRLNIGFSNNNDIVILPAGLIGLGNNISPTALLDLAASTTSRASLRIRSGTAPTSPNDGDMWTTTAGAFLRINGVTYSVNLTAV